MSYLFISTLLFICFGTDLVTPDNSNPLKRERRETPACDASDPYPRANGRCNNLNNPEWGSVGQAFRRMAGVPLAYEGSGPRLKAVGGQDLPSPRLISRIVHDFDQNRLNQGSTLMLMAWGQFLAHDITWTKNDTEHMTVDTCCADAATLVGGTLHADVTTGGPCFPIIVPTNDLHFTSTEQRCMEFIRSFPLIDSQGVRQQQNLLSSFIDGTSVYGSSEDQMTSLRSLADGKLSLPNENLPASDTNYCLLDSEDDFCLKAGDARVNVYPTLGVLHTVFARYHNYVAGKLKEVNSGWDDHKLFNMARKITIAVMQHITYNEYLPLILGDAMDTYNLRGTYQYDSNCDATLFNVFATAADRFGHSMVTDSVTVDGVVVLTKDLLLRPKYVLHSLESLLTAMITQRPERVDRWYTSQMTDHMFEETNKPGQDIAALNIQRGRDHGLAPYNEWRDKCNLPKYTSFDNFTNHVGKFRQAYDNVEDVDLYSGALVEDKVRGGQVGDTYACLLAQQFQNLRNCDRFWYQNPDPVTGFTSDQITEISKTTLAQVICRTASSVPAVQVRNVFTMANNRRNPQKSCTDLFNTRGIQEMDFTQFAE